MSGALPQALADAAGSLAIVAEARAKDVSPGRLIGQRLRTALAARPVREGDSLPARTWREIDLSVRTALLMLASDAPGDPRRLAAQPWESFSDADRASLAATARLFAGELRNARALW